MVAWNQLSVHPTLSILTLPASYLHSIPNFLRFPSSTIGGGGGGGGSGGGGGGGVSGGGGGRVEERDVVTGVCASECNTAEPTDLAKDIKQFLAQVIVDKEMTFIALYMGKA